MAKRRADQLLVDQGLAESRAKAQALILAGLVSAGGRRIDKPGTALAQETALALAGPDHPWVSRGGVKLDFALAHLAIDVTGAIALDIGASTGGFTDMLLARGAAKVYAVDVGRGQLHERLRADPRVVGLEATDARTLDARIVNERVSAIVADVSFISLTLVLPAALRLAAEGAWLVVLVKPQFEAGRAAVGKGRIVREAAEREKAVERVRTFIEGEGGWTILGEITSPILGGSGNKEFLIGARYGA